MSAHSNVTQLPLEPAKATAVTLTLTLWEFVGAILVAAFVGAAGTVSLVLGIFLFLSAADDKDRGLVKEH